MMRKFFFILALIFVGVLGFPLSSFCDLTINIIAVNPTEEVGREIEVKYYLPKELEPEDIVNTGKLKLDYHVDKEVYYVHGKINFGAKESKTFKIKVKDVWILTEEEIDVFKKQLAENLAFSKGSP